MPNVIVKSGQAPARDLSGEQKKARGCCSGLAEYTYRHGDHELTVFLQGADPHQIAAVREGEAEFALVVEEPVIVLCSRFGDAVPWTAARYAGDDRSHGPESLPPPPHSPHESRALLHVVAIDAESGDAIAERNVTLWLDFSRALGEAIRERSRVVYHPIEHDRSLARLRRRYPTDSALAASAAVRCLGSL